MAVEVSSVCVDFIIERDEKLTSWPNSRSCARVLRATGRVRRMQFPHDRVERLTVVVEKLFVEDSGRHRQTVRQGKGKAARHTFSIKSTCVMIIRRQQYLLSPR